MQEWRILLRASTEAARVRPHVRDCKSPAQCGEELKDYTLNPNLGSEWGELAVGEKRVGSHNVDTCKVDIQAPYVHGSTLGTEGCNLTYIVTLNDNPAIGNI